MTCLATTVGPPHPCGNTPSSVLTNTQIKENISIKTNVPSNNSKDQLINQAFKLHSQGNFSEAAKYYEYFIKRGFNDHRVFSNYGSILKNKGKLVNFMLIFIIIGIPLISIRRRPL